MILIGVHPTIAQLQKGVHGKTVTIYNTAIYYEEQGYGTPLLLLHGGTGSHEDFQSIVPTLSKNFRVIAPDSPGYGRSEQADSLSYPLLAGYASRLIDLLKLDSVYVIGFSDGGNAALLLAASRPEKVKRVMVSGANATLAGLQKTPHAASDNADVRDWHAYHQRNSPQPGQWNKLVKDANAMWDRPIAIPERELRKIRCSTLIIMGERDIITLEHGQYLKHMISGSRLEVIPDCGHYTFVQRPERMKELALEFFQRR